MVQILTQLNLTDITIYGVYKLIITPETNTFETSQVTDELTSENMKYSYSKSHFLHRIDANIQAGTNLTYTTTCTNNNNNSNNKVGDRRFY